MLAHLNGQKTLPPKAILITFDDGLKEQYELGVPIMDRLGIPGLFFVNTYNITEQKVSLAHKIHLLLAHTPFEEYKKEVCDRAMTLFNKSLEVVSIQHAIIHYCYDTKERAIFKYFVNYHLSHDEQEKIINGLFAAKFNEPELAESLYMSAEQLRELSLRGLLGTHSHRHIPLGVCDHAYSFKDIKTSIDILNNITGKVPVSISYPYGSYEATGTQALEACKDLGLQLGFTMERAFNPDLNDPLALARFDCNDLPGGKHPLFNKETFFNSVPERKWFKN